MKVILVHNYYPIIGGGEDSVVAEERAMLEKCGCSVVPFFMYTKERGFFDFAVSALCLLWNPFVYRRMRRLLQEEQPDIVHCHNTFPLISPSVYWACSKEGIPVVQTLHNYRFICANGLFLRQGAVCEACSGKAFAWPAIRYRCYRDSLFGSILLVMMQSLHRMLGTWRGKVNRYIALTDFSKSRFLNSGLLLDEQVIVKPNFIADPLTSGELTKKKKQAVFIGRLWPEKGCHILIEAWVKAYKSHPTPNLNGYELLVIGDGPERERVEALCNGNPSDFAIHFSGTMPRDEVLQTLKSSCFLVLPSIWYEGFPMTLVEAFACGVPVLSANIGSMKDIIDDYQTGLFFEAGSIEQLSDRIMWAASHEAEMETMGRRARICYEYKYSKDRNLILLSEIYCSLANSKQARSDVCLC